MQQRVASKVILLLEELVDNTLLSTKKSQIAVKRIPLRREAFIEGPLPMSLRLTS